MISVVTVVAFFSNCSNRNPEWKVKKRALMAEKGLYRRHSTDHPLLRDFAIYLSKDLNNENYKQEVSINIKY